MKFFEEQTDRVSKLVSAGYQNTEEFAKVLNEYRVKRQEAETLNIIPPVAEVVLEEAKLEEEEGKEEAVSVHESIQAEGENDEKEAAAEGGEDE